MQNEKDNFETGCCKRFNPESWDNKEINLGDRLFVKDRICSFLHIPLNFGRVMKRNMEKINRAGAESTQSLMLSDENSLWGADIYIAVTKDIPGAEMKKIPGTFLTKVFVGSYNNMGKWIDRMKSHVASQKKKLKKIYFFYTTCPACAKAYGKNYTVLLAEIHK